MTQQHPITPPPELVQQWWDDFNGAFYEFEAITATVFQAGADQELEACCEWLSVPCPSYGRELRNARRLKPPSLKEQALDLLDKAEDPSWDINDFSIIRRALEQLPDNN